MNRPKVVSEAEWVVARQELLRKEKEFTRERDALSAERRKLPWVKIDKEYVFDGPNGKETLADLFDGLTARHDGEHYRGQYANYGVRDKPSYPYADHPVVRNTR